MTTPNNSPRKSIGKKLAAVLVASTVLGVGVAGFEAATGSVAQAEAVRVETPAAAPGFADIIEKVSPAVVSVRVKTNIQPASNMQFNFNGQDLDQLPPPLQKFFRDFGPRFVELARSVYHLNDKRAALKRSINVALGSRLVEEKSYAAY